MRYNNQTEYEALLFGLEILQTMGVKHVEAFGDSELVVNQVGKVYQCLDGILNSYLDRCLDIISCFDEFTIYHVPRFDNPIANTLAQQAFGYEIQKRNFHKKKPVFVADQVCALNAPVRLVADTGRTGQTSHEIGQNVGETVAADSVVKADVSDWRTPIAKYMRNPSFKADRKIQLMAFKFTLVDDELYRRTADDLLLKCLGPDEARVAMGEVHEGICGTHQSAPKMRWLLRRALFYWPSMIADCFRYYKGCEECQRFGNVQLVPSALMHPIIKP